MAEPMRGLLVAGTGPDAAEQSVGATIAAAAHDAAAAPTTLHAGSADAGAPPAIAARHAGIELSPAAVGGEARAAAGDDGFLVAVTSGGLLAPLAERYLNRDLALELRLPVVLAAPAGAGLMNGALLAF